MAVDLATLAIRVDALEVAAAEKKLDALSASGARAEKSTAGVTSAFKALAATLGLVKLAEVARDAAMAYARYETLGAAMNTVGNNAGYTARQMAEYEQKLRSTGIAMTESRETLTKMAASHIDLAKATDLARIAQDAAVVGNINSSEAFDRMINGIRSAEVEVLRGIGLNVNFESSYAKLAAQLGKNAKDLTETEKTQARVNAVMGAGVGIAGTYEAAMGTSGKMINSMKRYLDDLEVSLGKAFGPSVTLLVDQMTVALKGANTEVKDGESAIDAWGIKFRSTVISIEAELIRLSMLIDKVGGTMTAVLTGAGELIDVARNIKGAVSDMYNGVDSGWTESELTKLGKKWNKVYEDRYNAGDKALQGLADLEAKLANEVKGGAAANEQARIKAGAAARTQQEAEDKAAAAAKDAAASAKKAHSEAAKDAKAHATELQRLIDKYLPLRGAAETVAEAEAGLNELRQQGAISIDEYSVALQHLREERYAEEEAATHAMELQTQLADAYGEVTMALMTDQERKVYDIEDVNSKLMAQIDLLQQENKITKDLATTWRTKLGEKMAKDIQAVNEEASQSTKLFEDMAKNIQSAFSGMFEDLIDGTGNMLDSLGTLFKKLLAQMATMAIANPIIVPIVTTIGSAMGMSENTIAKSLGMNTSALSGSSGMGGLGGWGSLLNTGAGAVSGSVASYLSEWGADLAFDGYTTTGSSMMSASDTISSLSSSASSAWVSGIGTFIVGLLSGKSFAQSSAEGAGAGGGMYAGASIGSYFGPWGTAIGGAIGGILGALGMGSLFGGDDPEFEFNPTISNDLDKSAYAAYLKDGEPGTRRARELDFGGSWNTTTNTLDSTFVESMIGKGTMTEVFAVWGQSVVAIQEQFNGYAASLAKALPEEVSESLYGTLAATDFSAILETASKGRWEQEDAEEALEEVLTKYGEAMLDTLADAVGAGITAAIDAQGAGSLVGSDEVWGLLTTSVQENIEKSLRDAATAISGGDFEGGLGQVQAVQEAVAAIGSAMAPISEIIDTNGLSEYELAVRSINTQFDQYAASLKAAGVDLAKYTELEEARSITLQKVIEQYREVGWTNFESAQSAVVSALKTIADQVQAFASTAASTASGVLTARQNISNALWAAQDEQTAAQERVNELLQQSNTALQSFAETIDDFLASLGGSSSSTASLDTLKAQLMATASGAAAGDSDAQSRLLTEARSVLDRAESTSGSRAEYARTEAFVRSQLEMVKSSTLSKVVAIPGADNRADLQVAQDALATATANVDAYLALAQQVGAETDRSTQVAADSVSGLTQAYNDAVAANIKAQADYQVALDLTTGLQFDTSTNLDKLRQSVADLGTANQELVDAMVTWAPSIDWNASIVTSALGLTGDSATALAGLLTGTGTAAETLSTLLNLPGTSAEALAGQLGLSGDAATDFVGKITGTGAAADTMADQLGISSAAAQTLSTLLGDTGTSAQTLSLLFEDTGTESTTLAATLGITTTQADTLRQQLAATELATIGLASGQSSATDSAITLAEMFATTTATGGSLADQFGLTGDISSALAGSLAVTATAGDYLTTAFSGATTAAGAIAAAFGLTGSALADFVTSISNLATPSTGGTSATGSTSTTYPAEIEAAYQLLFGRPPDAAGAAYWIASGMTGSTLFEAIRNGALGDDIAAKKLRGFATGVNAHLLGDGYVYAHAGEEIKPAKYVDAESSDRKETNALLRQMLARLEKLEQSNTNAEKHAKRTSDTLVRVTRDGESLVTVTA